MYNFQDRLAQMKKLGLVDIHVSDYESGPLATTPDGLIGFFPQWKKMSFILTLTVRPSEELDVVYSEGVEKTLKPINTWEVSNSGVITSFYEKRIGTTPDLGGRFTTKKSPAQGNGVWFISTANNRLEMWEVAIVTNIKGGTSYYYLSLQLVYKAGLYKKDDDIWVSLDEFERYNEWLSLQEFLSDRVDLTKLKPASRYKKAKGKKPAEIEEGKGVVAWFNQAQRFGFAKLHDGTSARVHASQILGQQFPALDPGQLISYRSFKKTDQGCDLIGVEEI